MKSKTIISRQITLLAVILISVITCGFAQQDSQYTQYMYNTQTINPAYAGNRGVASFTGIYRTQWVGLDGAPKTINFSFNTPLADNRFGLGLSVYNDEIGPTVENNIAADFSYGIPLTRDVKLSFGLKAGVNLFSADYNKLNIFDPTDANFDNNIDNRLSPTIGFGVYLNNDDGYLGLSVPNFLETTHEGGSVTSTAKEKMHLYFIGGYVLDLSNSIKFKPAFLAKATQGAPMAVDVSANFMFVDRFTLGAAYRLDAAVSGLAGFQVSDNIMIGYAYDYDTSDLGNYNSGSHEIFLRFELTKKIESLISPRFF